MPKKRVAKRKKAPTTYLAQDAQTFNPPLAGTPAPKPTENRLVVGLVLAVLLISVATHFWRQGQAVSAAAGASDTGGPWVKLHPVGKFRITTQASALKADDQGNLFVLTGDGIAGYHPSVDGGKAFASLKMKMPTGWWGSMAFDGRRFYVTAGDNSIRVVPKNLSGVIAKFKVHGAKDLFGIALSPDGRLYVTDRVQHCVFILSHSGEVLGKLGGPHGDQNFVYPVDVTFDSAGNVYTADFLNNQIKRFGPQGTMTTSWTAPWSNHDWERICILDKKMYIDGFNDHRLFIEDLSGANQGMCENLDDGTALDPKMVGAGLDGFLYVWEGDTGIVYKFKP